MSAMETFSKNRAGLHARILSLLLEINPDLFCCHGNGLYVTLFPSITILVED
jgi:hypothetical protein